MQKVRALVVQANDSNASLAERHQAFSALVENFQDMAYAYASSMLGDFSLAEDAAQEAFLTAWRKLSQIREPEAFPGWFRRIVLTECNRLTRGKRPRLMMLDDALHVPANQVHPQTMLEKAELKKAVFERIMTLPEKERTAVLLFYVHEYSQIEISRFLEVPPTTVAKRLHSARARLKGLLDRLKNDLHAHRPSRTDTFARQVRQGIYDEYVGEYRFVERPEHTVTIKREGDKLIGEGGGQINQLFADRPKNELSTREFDGKGVFARDEKGRITHFVYFEFGKELGRAKKIK